MKRFLIVLGLVSGPAFAEISDDPSKWQFESETDEFTDDHRTYALVVSETGMDGGFIHVMCNGTDYFEVKVGAGEYIGDKVIRQNVMYRVDKKEPATMTMKPTSKRYVYMNDINSKFVQDLMGGASSVIVRLTNYDYDTSQARFTLSGSTDALQKVLAACPDAN